MAFEKLISLKLKDYKNLSEFVKAIRRCEHDLTITEWNPPKWMINGILLERLTEPYNIYLNTTRQTTKKWLKNKGDKSISVYDELDFETLVNELKMEEARIKLGESEINMTKGNDRGKKGDKGKQPDNKTPSRKTSTTQLNDFDPDKHCKHCWEKSKTINNHPYRHKEELCYHNEKNASKRPQWWIKTLKFDFDGKEFQR